MIVISTNNGINYLPNLLRTLEKINENNIPISIIDTGSTDIEFISYLEELKSLNKYKILQTPYKGYDTGAYIFAYENIDAPYYIFLHDSVEIKHKDFLDNINNNLKDNTIIVFFKFDNKRDFIEILSNFYLKEDINDFPIGVFGPMFACSKQTMDLMYNSKLFFIPKDKGEQMAMERGWGIIAYKLKLNMLFFDDYSILLNDNCYYFKKHFLWSTNQARN
jgi:hypothetical protein